MSARELAAKLESLSPEHRKVVETLIELLAACRAKTKQRDLTGHPSFGAWSGRKDLPADSNAAARVLRKQANKGRGAAESP